MDIDRHWRAFSLYFALLAIAGTALYTSVAWFRPMVGRAKQVSLPFTQNPQVLYSEPQVSVWLIADGTRDRGYRARVAWIKNEKFMFDEALDRLRKSNPPLGARAVIHADARLPFRFVKRTIETLREAGYGHVFLAACSDESGLLQLSERWRRNHVVE